MKVFTYEPYGMDGTIIAVEADARPGIPSIDILGLSADDDIVAEARKTMSNALETSGIALPKARMTVSLYPAGIRKRSGNYALAMSLALIDDSKRSEAAESGGSQLIDEQVLVVGTLEETGELSATGVGYGKLGAAAAVQDAKKLGITHVICSPEDAAEIRRIPGIEGIRMAIARTLGEAVSAAMTPENFREVRPGRTAAETVVFDDGISRGELYDMKGLYKTARAVEVAVAGKHNLTLVGGPESGKELVLRGLAPYLTPLLTEGERASTYRLQSLAGEAHYFRKNHTSMVAPFRMPHPTASIEGMFGGGVYITPGEISRAHNGVLFLDDATEFKTSVLQLLRVPLERGTITISRAGRSSVLPAKFQLMMTKNPCPCGALGCDGRVCLDSKKTIELFNKKTESLEERCAVKEFVEKSPREKKVFDPDEARKRVARAYGIQRARGKFNNELSLDELGEFCRLDKKGNEFFEQMTVKSGLSKRDAANLLRVALTVANMDGREKIRLRDLKEAHNLVLPALEKKEKAVAVKEERAREKDAGPERGA